MKLTTWTQLESLTKEAKTVVKKSHAKLTPVNVFPAYLVILAVKPAEVVEESFGAYVPKPRLIHPVGWRDQSYINVMTNHSELQEELQISI